MIAGNIPRKKRSAPDLTISCKNWCAYTLSIIQKRYPRRLHFLRQFCSCPENITGEGVMDGVMKVRGGVTDGVMKVLWKNQVL